MSFTRGNGQNGGKFYSNLTQPVVIDVTFTVAPANTNGLGVSSVKSNGYVNNVFMHTTQTPGSNNGVTNPNPLVGYAWLQLTNNYKVYTGFGYSIVSPTTGSALTTLTAHTPYIIGSVGTTTTAQWNTAGLPVGFTPTVNQSFISTAGGALGGTGTVYAVGASGIANVEVIGDPNQEIANSSLAANGGAWVMVQFLNGSAAVTAPATNSVVTLALSFDVSSVTIDGL